MATLQWVRLKRLIAGVLLALAAAALLVPGASGARPARGLPPACPISAVTTLPAPRWPAARMTLAPTGAVAIRLCRYSGLTDRPPLALTRARLLTGMARVRTLLGDLDRLPAFGPGAVACPNDDSSEILAILAYRGGRSLRISVGLSGCASATNGIVVRTAEGFGRPRAYGPQLLNELELLTH